MRVTPAVLKTLRILAGSERPMRGREFAQAMWPDSPGWEKTSNVGTNGATKGVGPPRAGGSWLMKLQRQGLTCYLGWEEGYTISRKGREVLAEAEADQ